MRKITAEMQLETQHTLCTIMICIEQKNSLGIDQKESMTQVCHRLLPLLLCSVTFQAASCIHFDQGTSTYVCTYV